jgi:hypothetical protein
MVKKKVFQDTCNLLENLKAEIIEGADLLRLHYPDASDDELHNRAQTMLSERYRRGRWPTVAEIAEQKARIVPAGTWGYDWLAAA